MIKIGKYAFKDKSTSDAKITALGVDDEGNATHGHAIVKLGHIVLEQGEYEIKGSKKELIKEPVFSNKYHVDVIWSDLKDHPWGWKTYSCDLDTEGIHGFSGLSYLEYIYSLWCFEV